MSDAPIKAKLPVPPIIANPRPQFSDPVLDIPKAKRAGRGPGRTSIRRVEERRNGYQRAADGSALPRDKTTSQIQRDPEIPLPAPESKIPYTNGDVEFILKNFILPEHYKNPYVMAFVRSYIMCRDVPQAASEAGISVADGRVLMKKTDIQRACMAVAEEGLMRYGIDAAEIVEKVKSVAYVDPAELVDEYGAAYENLRDMPIEARRAIKKFEVKNLFENDVNGVPVVVGKLVKVEFWDKLKANEMLGREVKLFTEKKQIEHDVGGNMKEILLGAERRAEDRLGKLAADGVIDVTEVDEGE